MTANGNREVLLLANGDVEKLLTIGNVMRALDEAYIERISIC